MNTKSSEAMAFSASSAAQSPGKDPLPCLSNAEILKVAGEKQDWGSENGPADPVDEAMEDSVEPWYAHIPTLAAVYGEMCMINETLLNEQTDGQKERLKVLRSECVAAHNLRIEANLARNRAARVLGGWLRDPNFHDETGKPRPLSTDGVGDFPAAVADVVTGRQFIDIVHTGGQIADLMKTIIIWNRKSAKKGRADADGI